MKVLGLIPARGGSKGVPRKNIKLLGEKPLIQYTIDAALASGVIDELMVSTEDIEIAEVARQGGAETPFLRPPNLACDESPTIETIIHVLDEYQKLGKNFDIVCLLQATNPLRSADTIRKSIEKFKVIDADSLLSVREVPHEFNPHWTFKKSNNSDLLHISTGAKDIIPRRQELPKAFYRDGAIYLAKSKVIIEQKSLYGERISYINLEGKPHVNIDTMKDWELAEQLICAE